MKKLIIKILRKGIDTLCALLDIIAKEAVA